MASLQEASDAVARVFDAIDASVHMRPHSAGVIRTDSGFGLKVVLPYAPSNNPPVSLFGVPIEYHVAVGEPVMLGAGAPDWLLESRKRRSGG